MGSQHRALIPGCIMQNSGERLVVYVKQCHVLMAVFACKWPLGSPILQPDGGISFTRLSV
jgi:hypothetical protein